MPSGTNTATERLHHQRLVGSPFKKPEHVVDWLGAVQSQDFAGAKWAIAQRCTGTTSAALDRLFADGKLLRTHVLRPTWHFVRPHDIRWMLALTAPRVKRLMAGADRKLELTDRVYEKSNAILERELAGNRQCTRPELAAALGKGGIVASGQRLVHLLMRAELDALICSGARRGKQFTYALMSDRAPATKPLSREDSLGELARRYFQSRGPATAHDFAWWSGLTLADAKAGIESSKKHLVAEEREGKPFWSGKKSGSFAPSPTAHLLSNYDEHVVAYRDRAALVDPQISEPIEAKWAVFLGHVVLIDGVIAGTWRSAVTQSNVTVEAALLRRITKSEHAKLHEAVERYGNFHERTAILQLRRKE